MSVSKSIFITGALILIIFLTVAPGLAQGPAPTAVPPDFVPGEIIVKFQPNISPLGAQSSLRAVGLRPLEVSARGGLLRVQVAPGWEVATMTALLARGDVEFATYNYSVHALDSPNDPDYGLQWGLNQVGGHDIDAPEAWALHTGDSNITIAVVDSGVDLDHPDLQAKLVPGYDYVNDDSFPDDDNGHGTHVAGIAAAISNNGIGITGLSWGAKIMPLKMLDPQGDGSIFNLAQAVYFAVDNGAQVINMSLGGGCGEGWPAMEDAISYALAKDVLLVAASGNQGLPTVLCPAALEGVIAVGSTSENGVRSSFSNYGPELELVAPGSNIYSTLTGESYGYKSGTSMATPYVAGLAALLRSFVPSFASSQVQEAIRSSVEDLGPAGWDQEYGHGRINAWHALESITLQTSPPQTLLLLDDDLTSISRTIQITSINASAITWTATISPPVSWLSLAQPASGIISGASSPSNVTMIATINGITHNSYTTTVAITGTTVTGVEIGPRLTLVQLKYLPKLYRYSLPLIFKP